MPTDADIAWAAGLFEGEGCWRLSSTNPSSIRKSGRQYAEASLAMTDQDVVERFQAIVGVGTIYHQKKKHPHNDLWVWRASARSEFERVAELLRPWLGQRRANRLEHVLREGHKVHECKCDYCWRAYTPKRTTSYDGPFYCSSECCDRDRPNKRETKEYANG